MKIYFKWLPRTTALLAIVICLVCIVACACSDNDNKWLTELQQEVPFPIIIPDYFPSDIFPRPVFIGRPGPVPESNTAIGFTVSFRNRDKDHYISIEQENFKTITKPSNHKYEYFEIAETEMLEQEIWDEKSDVKGSLTRTMGYSYSWYRDKINYEVRIIGYDQLESRKVIRSMIK